MAIYKKMKDGKQIGWYYSCYYRDTYGTNKRKCSKTFSTKHECELAEIKFKQSVINRDNISTITFGTFCEGVYFKEKSKSWKASSAVKSKYSITQYCTSIWNKPINEIDQLMISTLYDDLLATHSTTGANDIFTRIATVFNYAIKQGAINKNPCHLVEIKRVPKVQVDEDGNVKDSRLNIWTQDEFKQFMTFFKDRTERHTRKYIAMFSLLYYTGLRIGEACALKISDVDLENQTVIINKSFDMTNHLITTPKTNSSIRVVYLNPTITAILKDYLDYISKFKNFKPEAFLFGLKTPSYYASINSQFNKAIKATGVKKIRIHDLRHSRASYMISAGYNIAFVSKQLGHTNITTTLNTYTSIMSDFENIEINKVKNEK